MAAAVEHRGGSAGGESGAKHVVLLPTLRCSNGLLCDQEVQQQTIRLDYVFTQLEIKRIAQL
jgi:hypothetical protein